MLQVAEQDLTQLSLEEKDSSPSATSNKTYTAKLIDTPLGLETVCSLLDHCDDNIFAFDVETNGTFDRDKIHMVGLSLSFSVDGKDLAFYLPFNHLEGQQLDIVASLQRLRPYFESDSIAKIAHNAKFDYTVMDIHNVRVGGVLHDTYVMAWLLSENADSKGLKPLVQKHFGFDVTTYEDVVSAAPKERGVDRDYNFARVSIKDGLDYAAADAYYALKLFRKFVPELHEQKLWSAYENVEREFVKVLAHIEKAGVLIDVEEVDKADKLLPLLVEEIDGQIYSEAGEVFNIASGQQLGKILFEKLGIGNNVRKTKSGHYATDKKTLAKYAAHYEIVNNVLRRKKAEKTHGTFVKGLKGFIGKDGRIHPNFNGCGTVTGRLSCNSPNLQQIEVDEVEAVKVRNFFVPAPGHKFIVADYSQIELRVIAHFSGDPYMIKSFNSGFDFHAETAKGMEERIGRPVTRKVSKVLNFAACYGITDMSIAEMLNIKTKHAKEFLNAWYETFEGVAALKEKNQTYGTKHGFIRTLTGRKRRLLPEIRSSNFALRSRALRQAFSSKIQGSAADLIKIAMIELDKVLPEYDAKMIMQIHDEVVIEIPEENVEKALPTIKQIMENPVNGKNPLKVPLLVEPKVVDRWGDAKDN